MSLYIHLPFCRSKCRYCDFYSLAGCGGDLINAYIDTLADEWNATGIGSGCGLKTVYAGGGTPSLLSPLQWERLYVKLLEKLPLLPEYEWTVECNPESLTPEKMRLFNEMGVNRLSVGVQSLDDRVLRFVNRPHTAAQVRKLFECGDMNRFASVNVDVMYGLPGQNEISFNDSLAEVLSYNHVTHLSAYELTVARETPLGKHRSVIPFPDEDRVGAMLDTLHRLTDETGMEQYEVSNFAKPGCRCVHNARYWRHAPYLGIGCAAHSYLHPRRFWNSSAIDEYIGEVQRHHRKSENEETLDSNAIAAEMVFLGVRQRDGIDVNRFRELTGFVFEQWVNQSGLEKLLHENHLDYREPFYLPARDSLYFADMMARTLLPDGKPRKII